MGWDFLPVSALRGVVDLAVRLVELVPRLAQVVRLVQRLAQHGSRLPLRLVRL